MAVNLAARQYDFIPLTTAKFCIFAARQETQTGGCGVIGSRARLRIWCRKAWGFESLHPHSPAPGKY